MDHDGEDSFTSSDESLGVTLTKGDKNYYKRFKTLYELDVCVDWILRRNFQKVCLQFPESLLIDSVDVAEYIERAIKKKVYILGDATYSSCCVDEVAAKHIKGDAVIHYGHACLSPVSIPSYYIFFKKPLNVKRFLNIVENYNSLETPILILYDVSYSHIIGELRKELAKRNELASDTCIADITSNGKNKLNLCSHWCAMQSKEYTHHISGLLSRAFCNPPDTQFHSIIYLGPAKANLFNFMYCFTDCKVLRYTEDMADLEQMCIACANKKFSYLVEKIKSAHTIGIVVATLGVEGYKEAINYAKKLCTDADIRSYIISVGKPNPAKLANFSEMDIFVAISCAETDFSDHKEYMQPIVGLYELDLALNKNRPWSAGCSRDFRDVVKGGRNYVEPPASVKENAEEAFEQIIPKAVLDQLVQSQHMQHSGNREWQGLEQRLGEDAPSLLTKGRTGSPHTSYSFTSEKSQGPSDSEK